MVISVKYADNVSLLSVPSKVLSGVNALSFSKIVPSANSSEKFL